MFNSILHSKLRDNPALIQTSAKSRAGRLAPRLANNWFDDLQRLSPESMLQLMSLGSKVQKLLVLKDHTVAALTEMDG